MNVKSSLSLNDRYDVAVVGLGPVGATLANLLALRGLRVLALDREPDIYRLPRAIQFDGECMRVFQTIGIADRLAPGLCVAPGMKFLGADGRLLLDWQRSTEIGPQGWHPSYRFHQPTLETLLRERLSQQPCVDVRLRHEVFSVEQDTSEVRLRLEDMSGGKLLQTTARYVIGCDGARSTIRRFMGTELEDLRSHERWLVVDVILSKERPDLGDHAVQYCDPARPTTYVRGPGNRRRWEFMLLPGEDAAVMSRAESIWQLLARWVSPDDADLERPAVYTFHSVVAKGWRRDRLLIAGDAAHQTPPFMGQGMAAGIRDASNLGWKLAQVIGSGADPDLLDTYESERAPHVREFIETAVRLGSLIQTKDPEQARLRDIQMLANPQVFTTPQPRLGPGLHDDTEFSGIVGEQPTLAGDILLDDKVGYEFSLLIDRAWEITTLIKNIKVIPADSSSAQDWLQRLGAGAVLLRPDRYITGVAHEPKDVEPLLNMASGSCAEPTVA